MREQWFDIPGWRGDYEASSLGRVRSVRKVITRKNGTKHTRISKVLKPGQTSNGFDTCVLQSREKGRNSYRVDRLIANTFMGERSGEWCVKHRKGRGDNRPENLYWAMKTEIA